MNVNWISHLENLLDKKRSRERSDHAKEIKTERKVHRYSSHQGSTHQGNTHQGNTHQGNTHQGNTHQESTHQGNTHQGNTHQGNTHQECSPPLSRQHVGGDHLGSPPKCDYRQLHAYRIEKAILENYKKEHIRELYPWQAECLSLLKTVRWEEGESFLFVAPTSGGKTLVAEIFAFEQMDQTEKTFFLFPLNSLINEKMSYLKKLCRGTSIKVGSELAENDIVLCTYERMNNYLNRNKLEGQGGMGGMEVGMEVGTNVGMNVGMNVGVKLGMGGCPPQGSSANPQGSSANRGGDPPHNYLIVIDEFHLISEKGRGIYIENIISKIIFLNRKQRQAKIKVICMSGTLNNFPALKKWMNAKIYVSPYRRPQEIKEHYICNCGVYRKEKEGCPFSYLCNVYDFYRSWADKSGEQGAKRFLYNVASVSSFKRCNLSDEMNTFHQNTKGNIAHFLKMKKNPSVNNSLVHSLLCFSLHSRVNNLNTLIFCSTKKNCEVYISLINQYFSAFPVEDTPEDVQLRRDKLNESIRQLDGYAHSTMSKLVANGICYYYSDITNSVKRLIEVAYKEKTLFLLTCTSTLSVGLNLLVDRVLISSPFIAQNFLSITQYRQMIGRAARQKKGDSFLLVEKRHEKKMLQIFQESCTNITSTMNDGGSLDEMEKYLIEFLCLVDARPVSLRDVVVMLSFSLCFAEVTQGSETQSSETELSEAQFGERQLCETKLGETKLMEGQLCETKLMEGHSADQSANQTADQSANQPDDQSANQPDDQPAHHPAAASAPGCPLEVDEENFTPSERAFYEAKKEQIHAVLNVLIQHKCVQVESNRRRLRLTNFCRSLCVSNFTASFGSELLLEVKKYDRVHLFNHSFHLCYLCSAHNLNVASFSYCLPFLKNLIGMICSDSHTKHIIFQVLEFDSDVINMLALRNQNNCFWKKRKKYFAEDQMERKHNKLYLSILLFLHLKGTTCSALCSLFKITEDVLQSVLQHTYMHVHILISFFDQLDEWILSSLLRKFLLNFRACRLASEEGGRARAPRGRRALRGGHTRERSANERPG
ncbi:DEAD/DEAH box helicase, putative [Plasmodium vivax]|uniref:DEAD/DEAH box helicase, putative n=1 Tax=Plasmodium vivax TaxID=5855 RepID=A0A1G4HJ17_PLAVI|nr:DEAD/DEAH box helicase, putative [Plasmodium vivax]